MFNKTTCRILIKLTYFLPPLGPGVDVIVRRVVVIASTVVMIPAPKSKRMKKLALYQ